MRTAETQWGAIPFDAATADNHYNDYDVTLAQSSQ